MDEKGSAFWCIARLKTTLLWRKCYGTRIRLTVLLWDKMLNTEAATCASSKCRVEANVLSDSFAGEKRQN